MTRKPPVLTENKIDQWYKQQCYASAEVEDLQSFSRHFYFALSLFAIEAQWVAAVTFLLEQIQFLGIPVFCETIGAGASNHHVLKNWY